MWITTRLITFPRAKRPQSKEDETRVHDYVRHFQKDCYAFSEDVSYVVTDAYYTMVLMTNGILESCFHQIGKMRCDANLRHLYTGEQKPKGRRRVYDGKLIIGEVDRLDFVGEQEGAKIYTAIVNCVNLKRDVRVVYLVNQTESRVSFALLFSTDTELDALSILRSPGTVSD